MATLSVQVIDQDGLNPTYDAVSSSDEFPNNGSVFVNIRNQDLSDNTVTIVSTQTVSGLAVADQTVVVPGGEDRFIGPFPASLFNNVNGRVEIQSSNTTSNTIAVLRVG